MIGLVDDGDLDAIETRIALAHVIDQTTGARNHDLGTGREPVALGSVSDTTEDGDHAQTDSGRQRFDDTGHLSGQLARGHQHQRARAIGLTRRLGGGQASDQWQREGDRLTRTGATLTQHVATGQRVRQRDSLNGERFGDSGGGQHSGQGGGNAHLHEAVVRTDLDRHDARGGRASRRRRSALTITTRSARTSRSTSTSVSGTSARRGRVRATARSTAPARGGSSHMGGVPLQVPRTCPG